MTGRTPCGAPLDLAPLRSVPPQAGGDKKDSLCLATVGPPASRGRQERLPLPRNGRSPVNGGRRRAQLPRTSRGTQEGASDPPLRSVPPQAEGHKNHHSVPPLVGGPPGPKRAGRGGCSCEARTRPSPGPHKGTTRRRVRVRLVQAGMTSSVTGNSTSGWSLITISWRPMALIGFGMVS